MRDTITNVESVVDDVSHLGSHMEGEPRTSHAGEGKPSYRLTARQKQALWRIQQVILAAQRDSYNNRGSEYDSNSECQDSEAGLDSVGELDEE
jgi:hypothetical protein